MILKLLFIIMCLLSLTMGYIPHLNQDPYRALLERTYRTDYDAPEETTDKKPLILTPLLKKNELEKARSAAEVKSNYTLPGVKSYAGYFTVNEKYNGNLWFWYFPAMNKPVEETPLILWLQGGPGASSMFGLFEEIGPFTITENMELKKKKYSWGDKYSLLFIDNPVGTGFSFSDIEGYATNQTTIGENLYSALQQFMTMFPNLRQVPFYIAGESYAGKHIPSLAIQIHWHKHADEPINLKGLMIGNGFIDPITLQCTSLFFRETGLIDDRTAKNLSVIENRIVDDIKKGHMTKASSDFRTGLHFLNFATLLPNPYNYLSDSEIFLTKYERFIQTKEMREALHVGSTNFVQIGDVYTKLIPDMMNSAKPWLNELLDHYRVLLYNGHLDTVVPYSPSVNTYNSLSFSGTAKYKTVEREPLIYNETLLGYYKEAGNLLEVMVRGAGHMVPSDKPEAALVIIDKFIG
ncbi:vitellogenic carboxypeptidase-like [Zerene cesonia]|uniref:vitellogenic carboxypeptidase-like n=1 Tax=Zerene cesonia TaxID=33412 RepID=UPI0018E568DB|nr:vitellogenic carboxypeptidase-like [Zerene cesonia]